MMPISNKVPDWRKNAPPGLTLAQAQALAVSSPAIQQSNNPALTAAAPLGGKPGNAAAQSAAANNGLSADLSRILRPQAAYRWLLPQLAQITPSYVEMTLRGALAGNHVQAWELFDLMLDSWPELGAVCEELTESVLRKKLIFEPFAEEGEKATTQAVERCKVASAAIRKMKPKAADDENGLSGMIKDILSAWFIGQSAQEISWDAGDGSDDLNLVTTEVGGSEINIIAPRATFWVHPVCVAWSMDGTLGLRTELNLIRQATKDAKPGYRNSEAGGSVWNTTSYQPRPTGVDPFPDNKFLIAINKSKSGTALGGARLRKLAFWWCASNFCAEWTLNRAQLFGLPIRWANYDLNAPEETIQAVCNMLQNMGSAGWGAFPAGTTLNLHEDGGRGGQSPQEELLDRADRYARSLILGQTMSGGRKGMAGGGGPGFGGVEKDVKEDRVDGAAKFASEVINLQFIPAILTVNYGDATNAPESRFLDEEEGTLQDAQRDSELAQAGLEIGKNFLRKKYNIPAPEPGEETIGGASMIPKPGQSPTAGAAGAANTAPGEELPPDDQVEARHRGCRHTAGELQARQFASGDDAKLVDAALADATSIAPRWLGAVRPVFEGLVAKAKDDSLTDHDFIQAVEKAKTQLPEVFGHMDHNALQRVIEQTMAAGVVNGVVRGALSRRSQTAATAEVVA